LSHKKYVPPEPVYKDVCIKLDANNKINNHEDYVKVLYDLQEVWPDFVQQQYRYLGLEWIYERVRDEYDRVNKFLEEGNWCGALLYRHCSHGFSWVIVDEFRYARLCESLGIANDFVVKQWGDEYFELVRRKVPPVTEAASTLAEPDNKPVAA